MPRILRRYPYAQLLLVLSLLLLLTILPVAQNPLIRTSLSSSIPSALGTSFADANSSVALPDSSQSVAPPVSISQSSPADLANSSAKLKEAYGVLPLSFEANSGQTNRQVKFLARGQGYGLFLTSNGAVLSLNTGSTAKVTKPQDIGTKKETRATEQGAVVSLNMIGANPEAQITGIDELPGKTNYFVGNDPDKWRKGISTYSKVRYSGVYPGIDVIYYGNQRQLEYDFVIAPGKDPRKIKLAFKGTSGLKVEQSGNLVLSTSAGEIQQAKPFAYQMVGGVCQEVSANYRVEKQAVTFALGNYDKSRQLIIDPVFVYSSFLGGASGDNGLAIAVDSQGSAYITGTTNSTDFPTVGPIQAARSTAPDAFVVKVNPGGTALVYSTYLGGNSSDTSRSIALDSQGNAYISGGTFSTDFPTTVGSVQPSKDNLFDGFISKINPSGSALVYSTYLGGDNNDDILGLAVTADGRAVVTGTTDSTRFNSNVFSNPRNGSSTFKSIDKADHWLPAANGLTAISVQTFAVDPSNSSIIYAASNMGLFKSTDGASNWNLTSLAGIGVTAIAIDPSNPSILYAGTVQGVYKSTNGGISFTQSNQFFGVTSLAIDPVTPTTLYAGCSLGLFKTIDGGNNWTGPSQSAGGSFDGVNDVVIDPNNSAILYAGTFNAIYKSTNGGAFWVSVFSSGSPSVFSLVIDPTNSQVIYAAAVTDTATLIKTTNGGANWVASDTGLVVTINGVQGPVQVNDLAIDPVTPSTLYAATNGGGIFKTTNAGANWSPSNSGLPLLVNGVTVDRNNPATLYVGALLPGDGFAARLNTSGAALEYLTRIGGDQYDTPKSVALDADGNAYIAGETNSPNFPTVNALQPALLTGSSSTAFVSKLNSAGTAFIYSTYLGGSRGDTATSIAVRDGNAFITGFTVSQDFPVVNAFKSTLAQNDTDAFVAKLNTSGTALIFSTFLGGSNQDIAWGVAVDSLGSAYVTGFTSSADFPVLAPPQPTAGGGTQDAFVTQFTATGDQLAYSTYLGGSGSDGANGIAVDSLGSAYVTGATSSNNFPTLNAFQSVRKGNDAFFTKIGPASSLATNVQFAQATYQLNESALGVQVVVTRTGHTSGETTVNYETSDLSTGNCNSFNGNASSKCDYEASFGTLRFTAGETSQTIYIPVVDDSYAEGNEVFRVSLLNATGAAIASPSATTITIVDNDPVNATNPIVNPNFFVRQHYIDFLNREPDAAGLAFWSNQITECEQPGATCSAAVRRINVSAAFFLSIEFQETGYLVERIYKTAFGDATGTSNFGPTHQLAVPIVRLNEFLPDSQQLGKGLVVGQLGWEQVLENNKVAFILQFVQRSRFSTSYSALLTPAQFVDQLFAHAGVTPTAAERTAAINEFGGAPTSNDNPARARALRRVAENSTLNGNEKNRAFVLMQYFGYLRRNPNDPQDTDYSGYDFWLTKLNEFNGNFVNADMVQAFIDSGEYRGRFGP